MPWADPKLSIFPVRFFHIAIGDKGVRGSGIGYYRFSVKLANGYLKLRPAYAFFATRINPILGVSSQVGP